MSYAVGKVLEVGIGTGENMKYYNKDVDVSVQGDDYEIEINWYRLV